MFAGGEALGQLWLFWLAPLLGAAVAGLMWSAFGERPAPAAAVDDWDDLEDLPEADEPDERDAGTDRDAADGPTVIR